MALRHRLGATNTKVHRTRDCRRNFTPIGIKRFQNTRHKRRRQKITQAKHQRITSLERKRASQTRKRTQGTGKE